VDGGDDLGVVDSLQVDRRDAEVRVPQLTLDDGEWDALVGELDCVRVAQLVGREAAAHPGLRGDAPQLGAGRVARPGPATSAPLDYAQERTDGHPDAQFEPGAQVLPAPGVHADLAAAAALAVADEHRARTGLEVVLGQGKRLVNAQPGAPEQHDQGSHTGAVDAVAGLAHDRDDLLDRGRIGRVAQPFVARRATGEVAGQGDRRAPAAGGV
jgi:hypothetical protein